MAAAPVEEAAEEEDEEHQIQPMVQKDQLSPETCKMEATTTTGRAKMGPSTNHHMVTRYVIIVVYLATKEKNAQSKQLTGRQALPGYITLTGTKRYPTTTRPKLLPQQQQEKQRPLIHQPLTHP